MRDRATRLLREAGPRFVGFFALWLAWLLFPIFTSPFNDSLDISRLLVHPIRPRTLVAAMTLGTVYDYMTVLTAPFVVAVLVVWAGEPA